MLQTVRTVGIIEGCSTLALFGIAMPLKYAADMPLAVTIVGSVHGVLFIAYCLLLLYAGVRNSWPFGLVVAGWCAAVLPFGPFIYDRQLGRRVGEPAPAASA